MTTYADNITNDQAKEQIAYFLEVEKELECRKDARRQTNLRYLNTEKGKASQRKANLKYYCKKNNKYHEQFNPNGIIAFPKWFYQNK